MAFLVDVVPGGSVGIAIIILTILVKLALFPLSQRSIENQAKMNFLTPEINKIKASGVSKEEQAKQTFELYKKHKTNPFSGCLLVLIQFPIIIALYSVFFRGINFSPEILYSFVHVPDQINNLFFGTIDLTQKSLILAILASVSQFFQAHYMPKPPASATNTGSFQESLSKSMAMNMKYFFPILVFAFLYTGVPGIKPLSAAVALYWLTSNLFAIGQQIYSNRKKLTLVEVIK